MHCPNATSEHAREGEGGRGLAERFELSFVRRGKGKEADFEGTFARETEGPLPVILEKKHGVLNEAYDAVAANEAKALAANRRPRDALDELDAFAALDVRLLGNRRTWDAGDVQTWLEAEGWNTEARVPGAGGGRGHSARAHERGHAGLCPRGKNSRARWRDCKVRRRMKTMNE